MKIAHKKDTIERKNSECCIVTEYPTRDESINFAIVRLSGRYPEKQRVTNKACQEIVYIQEGRGAVEVEGKRYPLEEGDLILIEANEKFFWEGEMTLYISCQPAFYIEQHQAVE